MKQKNFSIILFVILTVLLILVVIAIFERRIQDIENKMNQQLPLGNNYSFINKK